LGAQLDPEVKWRTMIGLFVNYVSAVHRVLGKQVDELTHKNIIEQIAEEFWGETGEQFMNIFDINPGTAVEASRLKQILASLLDIKSRIESENEDEVIIESEYRFCPVRIGLRPVLGDFCKYCELIGQIFINKIDPHYSHKIVIEGDICRHITTRLKESEDST
jgi:hypothetical protein